jgi:hypothetical protein
LVGDDEQLESGEICWWLCFDDVDTDSEHEEEEDELETGSRSDPSKLLLLQNGFELAIVAGDFDEKAAAKCGFEKEEDKK